jgi:hypothetical protein
LVGELCESPTLALPKRRSMADLLREGKRIAQSNPEPEI